MAKMISDVRKDIFKLLESLDETVKKGRELRPLPKVITKKPIVDTAIQSQPNQ